MTNMKNNVNSEENRYTRLRERVFKIIQIGYLEDIPSVAFDITITVAILINIFSIFFETFESARPYYNVLSIVEFVTVILFTIEYILRLWTADLLYPNEEHSLRAMVRFIVSFYGLVDLMSFLPYWLPVVFPTGMVAFRILRVLRILRLFRINAYYDAFNVIGDVIKQKRSQILSALMIVVMMVLASSLVMYSLEHEAQPDVFQNAFSGVWWAVSTLLTVGYGDIYPITTAGKMVGILLAFLGVGIVAIPTGIISAGFVEQYTKIKNMSAKLGDNVEDFVTVLLEDGNEWIDEQICDVIIPQDLLLVAIIRNGKTIVTSPTTVFKSGDVVIFYKK